MESNISLTENFNGKRYHKDQSFRSKKNAQNRIELLHNHGVLARIVIYQNKRTKENLYVVYTRLKDF